MGVVVVRRALAAIPLIFLISVGAYSLQLVLPGDPAVAMAGDDATAEQIEAAREELNLDDPAVVRYGQWMGGILTGDFGESIRNGIPVSDELQRRLPVTLTLAGLALGLSLIVGIPIGLTQGVYAGRLVDRGLLTVVSVMLATPPFWIATLMVAFFAVRLGWLPSGGYVGFGESPTEWAKHLVLPVVTLSIFVIGEIARQLRTGLVTVMDRDYVRASRARGLSNARVVGKHALRNAAMPALTIIGVRIGHLMAGSIIIEQIFRLPGLGTYTLNAIQNRDFPVIQGVVLAAGLIVVTVSLVIDIAYAALNPRVRVS